MLLTLEIVKLFQAFFISWDHTMYDMNQGIAAGVQASNLNEELGQIEYLFSDKTGTLTCNVMEFKKFCVGNYSYGTLGPAKTPGRRSVENVNFEDEALWDHLSNKDHENHANLERFLTHLSICHSIIVDQKTGKYNASSPDELALVNAAKFFGAEFKLLDEDNNMIINFKGQEKKYKLLNILEFNSTRKRMSVIVEDCNGSSGHNDIYIMTKGADSIIIPRLDESNSQNVEATKRYVDNYAEEGLRTLLLGQRRLSYNEYHQWAFLYNQAMNSVNNRDEEVAKVSNLLECNL